MKIYEGTRIGAHHTSRVFVKDGQPGRPYELKLHNAPGSPYPHSPDGHAWGYSGSGPTQMALDILYDLLGEEPDRSLYMKFREAFISPVTNERIVITEEDIRAWMTLE